MLSEKREKELALDITKQKLTSVGVFHACERHLFVIAENGLRNTTRPNTRDWFYKFRSDLPFQLFPDFSALPFVHNLSALQTCSFCYLRMLDTFLLPCFYFCFPLLTHFSYPFLQYKSSSTSTSFLKFFWMAI